MDFCNFWNGLSYFNIWRWQHYFTFISQSSLYFSVFSLILRFSQSKSTSEKDTIRRYLHYGNTNSTDNSRHMRYGESRGRSCRSRARAIAYKCPASRRAPKMRSADWVKKCRGCCCSPRCFSWTTRHCRILWTSGISYKVFRVTRKLGPYKVSLVTKQLCQPVAWDDLIS